MEKSAKSERKNGNGAQRNVLIFQNNALTLLKLSVGLDHMYTKEHIFRQHDASIYGFVCLFRLCVNKIVRHF